MVVFSLFSPSTILYVCPTFMFIIQLYPLVVTRVIYTQKQESLGQTPVLFWFQYFWNSGFQKYSDEILTFLEGH